MCEFTTEKKIEKEKDDDDKSRAIVMTIFTEKLSKQ
jgi:hypothetical protein